MDRQHAMNTYMSSASHRSTIRALKQARNGQNKVSFHFQSVKISKSM